MGLCQKFMPGNGGWTRARQPGPASPGGVCCVCSRPTSAPAEHALILRLSFADTVLISTWRPWERWEKGPGLGLTHPLLWLLCRSAFGKRTGRGFPGGALGASSRAALSR